MQDARMMRGDVPGGVREGDVPGGGMPGEDPMERYIEVLGPKMAQLFSGDSSGHDLHHSWRTMRNALYLQEREGGDRVVVGVAALLHDVHRAMENRTGAFVPPAASLKTVRDLLADVDLTARQVDRICFCIEHHEDYNWNGDNVADLDAHIVQDADNLDAVGAMGIARTFAYAGARGLPLYDAAAPLDEGGAYREADGGDASAIHHFYRKAFKLAQNMNTETAREMALERTAYMRGYVDRFLAEWDAQRP